MRRCITAWRRPARHTAADHRQAQQGPCGDALASGEVKKQLGQDGTEITPGQRRKIMPAFIDQDEKKWAQLVKASGVEQE